MHRNDAPAQGPGSVGACKATQYRAHRNRQQERAVGSASVTLDRGTVAVIETTPSPPDRTPIIVGCTLPPAPQRPSALGLRPLRLTREPLRDGTGLIAYDLDGARLAPLPAAVARRLIAYLDQGFSAAARVNGFTEDGGIDVEVVLGA